MLKPLGSRLTYANVMATVAVFLALGGGAYALSGIPDRGGVFHGCASNATGALRVVKSSNSCQKPKTVRRNGKRIRLPGESAISWNQHGPRGVEGLQGLQGVQGVQGVQGQRGPSDVFHTSTGGVLNALPAGDYAIFFREQFDSGGTTPLAGKLSCQVAAGAGTFDSVDQSYPAGGSASVIATGTAHVNTGGAVSYICSESAGTGSFHNPQITAIQVGARHES